MQDTLLETTKKFVPKCTATEAIVILLNVSYALQIDADTLVKIFRKEESPAKWAILLDEFFPDCPLPFIREFMEENDIALSDLKDIYGKLPLFFQNSRFKKVLADGRLE